MKRIFRRLAALVIVFVICTGIAVVKPVINEGYRMYKEAVEKEPINLKVEEIKNRDTYTTFDGLSPVFVQKLIQSEDRRFYKHPAVDPVGIARAVITNIVSGKITQGGSTITQQLAKNMYFSFEKELPRKIAEVFVAMDLEKQYTKDEILALYCSVVYFGQNCYGVQQAALYYYGVSPAQLDEEQSAELVAALKAPSVNNPSTK